MIWSAISWSGVGWLCKIEGNINSKLYKTVVNDDLGKSINDMCQKLNLRHKQVILPLLQKIEVTGKMLVIINKYCSKWAVLYATKYHILSPSTVSIHLTIY